MSDYLIQRLIRLASRPITYPTCPLDGAELDLHFHGGATCPQCGSEYDLGQDDRLLPPERTVDEHAAQWPNTLPWGDAEQDFYRTATAEEWMPNLTERPWPFIYHPPSGWLAWGQQNGLHEHIQNSLYQQGMRVPPEAVYGRYYPGFEPGNQVHIYEGGLSGLPVEEQQKHLQNILQNAPGRPQEAPGSLSSDFWGTVSSTPRKDEFPLEEEEEWEPTIPTLDEMVEIERWHRPVD